MWRAANKRTNSARPRYTAWQRPSVLGKWRPDKPILISLPYVVPATAPRSGAFRSVYLAGILEDFHRPAGIRSGICTPLLDRAWAASLPA